MPKWKKQGEHRSCACSGLTSSSWSQAEQEEQIGEASSVLVVLELSSLLNTLADVTHHADKAIFTSLPLSSYLRPWPPFLS
eukprot:762899-Hanusia_phi.AAC.4